jgi:hypothetical protein
MLSCFFLQARKKRCPGPIPAGQIRDQITLFDEQTIQIPGPDAVMVSMSEEFIETEMNERDLKA